MELCPEKVDLRTTERKKREERKKGKLVEIFASPPKNISSKGKCRLRQKSNSQLADAYLLLRAPLLDPVDVGKLGEDGLRQKFSENAA